MDQPDVRRSPAEIPLPPPYHGLHPAPVMRGFEPIVWLSPTRRSDVVRVRRHTCECVPIIYELCHSGGLLFIRRTVRNAEGPSIHESERLITVRMEALWERLITGQAR
ncbi:hypothetical protein MPTA5024_12360 [Microbispora sp. ATCC PTA-5024]|nr:hypothetical protein MPTA5024_12360 [Microbispora sp. ATCC PTA-5024]